MRGLEATPAGERNRRLYFFAAKTTETGRGAVAKTKGAAVASAWGKVSYGTAVERREAGKEGGRTMATARIPATAATREITDEFLCELDGATWDVKGSVPYGRRELDITLERTNG